MQPQTFLTVTPAVSRSGYLLVKVANTSPRAMDRIIVEVSGGGASKTIRLPAVLKAKSAISINTGIVYLSEAQVNYRVRALKAVLAD